MQSLTGGPDAQLKEELKGTFLPPEMAHVFGVMNSAESQGRDVLITYFQQFIAIIDNALSVLPFNFNTLQARRNQIADDIKRMVKLYSKGSGPRRSFDAIASDIVLLHGEICAAIVENIANPDITTEIMLSNYSYTKALADLKSLVNAIQRDPNRPFSEVLDFEGKSRIKILVSFMKPYIQIHTLLTTKALSTLDGNASDSVDHSAFGDLES